jgi:hypothetical protein
MIGICIGVYLLSKRNMVARQQRTGQTTVGHPWCPMENTNKGTNNQTPRDIGPCKHQAIMGDTSAGLRFLSLNTTTATWPMLVFKQLAPHNSCDAQLDAATSTADGLQVVKARGQEDEIVSNTIAHTEHALPQLHPTLQGVFRFPSLHPVFEQPNLGLNKTNTVQQKASCLSPRQPVHCRPCSLLLLRTQGGQRMLSRHNNIPPYSPFWTATQYIKALTTLHYINALTTSRLAFHQTTLHHGCPHMAQNRMP